MHSLQRRTNRRPTGTLRQPCPRECGGRRMKRAMGSEGYGGDCKDAVKVGYETGASLTRTTMAETACWMSSGRETHRCPPPNRCSLHCYPRRFRTYCAKKGGRGCRIRWGNLRTRGCEAGTRTSVVPLRGGLPPRQSRWLLTDKSCRASRRGLGGRRPSSCAWPCWPELRGGGPLWEARGRCLYWQSRSRRTP